ncbi:hypothetical protein NFB33_004316 [Escherichia albertii]|nr:hypothetical protein [Escherichia albertii]
MDNTQQENTRKEKPDNIFVILGIVIINIFLLSFLFTTEKHDRLIAFALNLSIILLTYLDARTLIKSGYNPTISKGWAIIFGPLFFAFWVWKRYTWLGDKTRILFWILLLSTIVSFYYSYNTENKKILSETACELSTKIMNEQYNLPNMKCSRVVEIKEIDNNFYKARAIFNNGTTQNITIDVREENGQEMVYVSLNPLDY